MHRIVIASNNQGKIQEMVEILQGLPCSLVAQGELGVTEVAETGLSFVENAIIKARHAAQLTGLPAIADDSGLEVEYLKGAPGIYSARYAGPQASDQQNLKKLLNELSNISSTQRNARFQCIAVYLRYAADPTPIICQGTWEGQILNIPQGTHGFGYDPIFYIPTLQCSAAELSNAQKNHISHRAQAFKQLAQQLNDMFSTN